MKLTKLVRSWDELITKTKFTLTSNVFLSFAVGVLAMAVFNKEPVVTLVPPTLTKEATVGARSADAEYLMSWGMYFATMTGNVTPKNVVFVADAIGAITSPELYPSLRRQLFSLAADPIFSQRGGSVSFEAESVSYDAPSQKVFVVGDQISRTTAGEQKRTRYVYEIKVEVQAWRPVITAVDHYEGALRTAKWERDSGRSMVRRTAGAAGPEEAAQPWVPESVRFQSADDGAKQPRPGEQHRVGGSSVIDGEGK